MSCLRKSCVALMPLLACSVSAQQQAISCTSQAGRPHACPVDTFYGVLLVHEISSGLCIPNKTWRYDQGAIYVSKGCSAEFLTHPRRTDPRSQDGYQIHGSGENAFHTNGVIRPGPGATDVEAGEPSKQETPKPK